MTQDLGNPVCAPMEYTNANFQKMRDKLQEHFDSTMALEKLFKIDCDVEEMWNLYLDTLPQIMEVENRWHDCTACHRWFRKAANIVALTSDNQIITLWSGTTIPEYEHVFDVLNNYLLNKKQIKEAFFTSREEIGIATNYAEDDNGNPHRHDHFFLTLPKTVIRDGIKVGQTKDKVSTNRQVFERSLNEISLDALNEVIDLIEENNLYRGQQWYNQLKKFRGLKRQVINVDEDDLNNWYWLKSREVGSVISKIKNHSIGVLLLDLSKGVDLDTALKRYEQVVAPSNYQRPKEIFTKKMLEEAKQKIEELGYSDSLLRRYAVMEDLSIKDVIFADRNVASNLQDSTDFFEMLEQEAIVKPINFDYIQAISLDEFIADVIPNATEVKLYTEMSLINNFVSLIAPVNKDAPSMFKWNNPFSWAYKNNMTDSMKEQVKAMGGDVDVDLRFSIRWNNTGEWDKSDLDAHCTEPGSEFEACEIYYSNKQSRLGTGGWLDVDIIDPKENVPAVENIRFKDKNKMRYGEYLFRVQQFTARSGNAGFEAEIEFDGQIYHFTHYSPLRQNEYVDVAKVIYHRDGHFELVPILDNLASNVECWNVKMNDFIPVNLICYSPNYWEGNATGNQHVFFMLKDCINDDTPNAWFNEYLNDELKEKHKKVMAALGRAAKVQLSDNQLSGIGLATTRAKEVTFKVVANNEEKIYKVIV